MDTTTKIILGTLAGVTSVCATLIFILTKDATITVVFTGIAGSCISGIAGVSYGAKVNNAG